ncbi:hypothetical protein Tco_1226631 [Tanacetum coccineum]
MTTLAEFRIIAGADNRPPMLEKSFYDSWKSRLAVPVFNQKDDPIYCLNKAMAFLTAVASSRFPSTNNQLRTSSNPRNQATIQDDRVTMQQVQGRQRQSYIGNSYKGNATSSGGIMQEGRQGWLNVIIIKVKVTWLGNALSRRGLGMLLFQTILDGQVLRQHSNIASFWTEDLDAYDSNSDDVSNAKAVMMATLSNYSSGVISKRLNIDLSTREKMIYSQMDDMIKEKLALKKKIDSLEQNLSNQIKENESLMQTFTVFKNESKEKESKYMDKKINLEKKIKELDNIVYKKAQRIKPTLYDGGVISSQHAASPMIDDEETLILEELNRLSEDFGKHFILQQELSDEQAFWLQTSHSNTDQSTSSPVKIEAPKELHKITPDAIIEGEWGFEHSKTVFK